VIFTRSGLGPALLATILLCFSCSSTSGGTGNQGAAGQTAGRGGQGGASAAQSGSAGESAGDGADSAGSSGDGSEAGTSGGGAAQTGDGGTGAASSNGGTVGSAGNETAGSTARGGGLGRDECAWDPISSDHCPVCDAHEGCARPSYKYVGSGAITSSCCGLEWQEETAPGEYTWSEAVDYCASLSLLGSGWRLPKIAELFSLVDLSDGSHTSPAIDVEAFADTLREAYWSSSLGDNGGQAAWGVNFSDGASQSTETDQPHRVRCVR